MFYLWHCPEHSGTSWNFRRLQLHIKQRAHCAEAEHRRQGYTKRSHHSENYQLSLKMLSLHGFQPSRLSPFVDFCWPTRSLWPQVRPLLDIHRHLMLRNIEEMRSSLELLQNQNQNLQKEILQEIHQTPASEENNLLQCQLEKKGDGFALTVDTKDFSAEELSVEQVDNKLQVSGKTEKRQEDGKGSFSYRVKAFRMEIQLPEGVNPEAVTCSWAEGKLHIQAPGQETPAATFERVAPVNCPTAECTEQSEEMTKGDDATDAADEIQQQEKC
ncbi:heat shock protein 30-like [Engraulis encrasicolus]|uniref:heat shock protein 30-like n=1 Tax=Engraulis encrasicolus TaxID=184585 RepID=UPI002FD5BF0A